MPTDSQYCRYEQTKDGHYELKHKRRGCITPCHRLWTGCVITTTGEVLPCCYDKAGHYSFGNILQQDWTTIYHSDKAQSFRKQVVCGNTMDICRNCGE